MKKIMALVLALLMVAAAPLALASCSGKGEYTVGIIQLIQHEALDAATKGFKDVLIAEFGEENIKFEEVNAQGDSTICTTAATDLVNKNVDLILGTSVTEYGVALEIKDFSGTVGGNVSGTSDLAPLDQQAAMINELYPRATYPKVGLLYCSAEPNSKYQVTVIREELKKLGYADADIKDFPFADSNDIGAVSKGASEFADVLYVPTDNTAASFGATIKDNIGNDPLIAGESGICGLCGIATLSIDYYELGKITGEMAVKILKGEAKVGELEIASVPAATITKKYNTVRAAEIGFTAPEGYAALPTE